MEIANKNNISKFKECYGCGVCVKACPTKIIKFKRNSSGFYSPFIDDQNLCINCGICLDVCAYNHNDLGLKSNDEPRYYGAWNNDEEIRQTSTTAGIGYGIADMALEESYKVCGVTYNPDIEAAEHILIDAKENLYRIQGTKYIPSNPLPAYDKINLKNKYIIFGLPCQIDSLRRYAKRFKKEESFILIDLFCYGVPSLLLWERTLKEIKKKYQDLRLLKFRSKELYGWHSSACFEFLTDNSIKFLPSKDSYFYKLFFSNSCLNRCCYNKCKYKHSNSSADIRIGDFWGKKYANDEKGVNLMISLTPIGDKLINKLKNNCHVEPVTEREALQGQMSYNAPWSPARQMVLWGLRHQMDLRILYYYTRILNLIYHSPTYIKRLLKLNK
ncbi:MAG: 4Fe-4S binding protein [Bacteroides sp.]|nr:4Fe-4S binding protein [Bacteroides sp.]